MTFTDEELETIAIALRLVAADYWPDVEKEEELIHKIEQYLDKE